jgi:hypothetical protein
MVYNRLTRGNLPMQYCKAIIRAVAAVVASLAAIGATADRALAQAVPAESGPQITFTPYLWLANINTAVKTQLPQAPTVNSEVGAFQLLGHLDGVPFVGTAELRDGPFSLLGDALHFPVGTNITTRNIFFQGGNAALTMDTGTALLLYHVIDQPVQELDTGFGFRAWGISTTLTLNSGLLPGVRTTRSADWADPLLAVRYRRDFGNGLGLTVYGDFGGFDVGAHVDWQVVGTLDYELKPWATLRVGYRSLNFNYQGVTDVGFNVHMKGPVLGATFRF